MSPQHFGGVGSTKRLLQSLQNNWPIAFCDQDKSIFLLTTNFSMSCADDDQVVPPIKVCYLWDRWDYYLAHWYLYTCYYFCQTSQNLSQFPPFPGYLYEVSIMLLLPINILNHPTKN